MRKIEWTTHMLSGALAGYAVTSVLKGAIIGGIAGVIPDLDEPRSKFGRMLPFVSISLNRLVGHRTFTHSLLFAGIAGLFLWPFIGQPHALAVTLGILAHVAGDLLTGKVQVLYPNPMRIGISVSRFGFLVMDRLVRISLIVIIVAWIFTG
ncbi:metal-dependent hydrolase [Planifilum fimeticola]|nr:metal-dependent hydrolase [Planifilum fimeticola]